MLGFITASVATGLILLAVLGAPALLTGYLAFMLASVAALAAITLVWKISIHCAVAAGSVTILALVYGPLVLGGYLLVGSTDPAVHERVFAVLADGLRARADRRLCACAPGR